MPCAVPSSGSEPTSMRKEIATLDYALKGCGVSRADKPSKSNSGFSCLGELF